ncbi:heptaprenyl diphosphate synthase component 1 [Domibacillus robiginosus]|uniref:heptaprenyl diphosphate synthase component 1 n=1 Tax=Domibacillus robiginosus TaxID=1071054 RepID=UPI00067C02E4|nr:heptaprenyl diphosphate synthase component 1 [Domibacillus robiginosus]
MKEWQEQQSALLEEINRACGQPFLNKVIGMPVINPLRASALMLAFTDQERKSEQVQKQMQAAVLIGLAMDVHDAIPSVTEEMTQKNQLIVLAGDYFSGMYYRTLAEADCVHWVGILAGAVKRVNEAKTSLHRHQLGTIEAILNAVGVIEGDIIGAVHTEKKTDEALARAVRQLLTADRLLREKKQPFILFSALKQHYETDQQVLDIIDQHLDDIQADLRECIKGIDSNSAAVIEAERDRLFESRPLRLVEEG